MKESSISHQNMCLKRMRVQIMLIQRSVKKQIEVFPNSTTQRETLVVHHSRIRYKHKSESHSHPCGAAYKSGVTQREQLCHVPLSERARVSARALGSAGQCPAGARLSARGHGSRADRDGPPGSSAVSALPQTKWARWPQGKCPGHRATVRPQRPA